MQCILCIQAISISIIVQGASRNYLTRYASVTIIGYANHSTQPPFLKYCNFHFNSLPILGAIVLTIALQFMALTLSTLKEVIDF